MPDTRAVLGAFRDAGYRITGPRRVLARLIGEEQGHFTADDLVARSRAGRLGLGRATIFRSLDVLAGLGVVERLDLPSGEHAFVGCEPSHHHHLVCSVCGSSTDVADSGLADLVAEVGRRSGYRIETHRLELFGTDVGRASRAELPALRRRIGIVFQDFRLLDHMSTYENVALPLRILGRAESSYRQEVIELLHWVGLGERLSALPPVLSGGEKQRAAIARAVIARPQLLLADEPTGNVDPSLGRRLLHLFMELNKSGTSIVIATHDIALMDQFDARRLVLHDGRLHLYD